jgi:hypothetical protein
MLLVLLPLRLGAQAPASHPVLDSASVARAAWGRMNAARRAGISPRRAPRHFVRRRRGPTQSAYQWGRAVFAARTGDTAGALAALRDYAALGLGRDLASDSVIAALRVAPGFDRRSRGARPQPRAGCAWRRASRGARQHALARGRGLRCAHRSFFLASVRRRTARASRARRVHAPALAGRRRAGIGAILGVRVDTARRRIWATTSGIKQMAGYAPGDSAIAALLLVDPGTRRIERRWDLPVIPGGHVLGDLALGTRGDVWFTDSNEPVLYRLRSGADTLDRFRHPLFRSLQGMAPTSDGQFVYVADYSHGLLRVRVSDGSVIRLPDAGGSTSLGCDGIVLHRGAIVAVQNGVAPPRVARFALNATGDSIVGARVCSISSPHWRPSRRSARWSGTTSCTSRPVSGRRTTKPGAGCRAPPLPAARLIAVPVDDVTH